MIRNASTNLQPDSLEAQQQGATPGIWRAITLPDGRSWVEELESARKIADCHEAEDAAFIAHAQQATPVLLAEIRRLRAVEAAAYAFADEMGDYCSHGNIAAEYAKRLRERLDQAQPNHATDRARHNN